MYDQLHTYNNLTVETNPLTIVKPNPPAPQAPQAGDVIERAAEMLEKEWDNVKLMPYRTAFIVCDTDGLETYKDASDLANEAMSMLAMDAGGSMSFRGKGKYVSSSQGMVSESVHLVECFYISAETQLAALPKIAAFLRNLQRERNQESVAIKFNSALMILY